MKADNCALSINSRDKKAVRTSSQKNLTQRRKGAKGRRIQPQKASELIARRLSPYQSWRLESLGTGHA